MFCGYFWRIADCLGFAPRSGSFAFEPLVQVSSIPSLSGLISFRPYANPPNSKMGVLVTLSIIKETLLNRRRASRAVRGRIPFRAELCLF